MKYVILYYCKHGFDFVRDAEGVPYQYDKLKDADDHAERLEDSDNMMVAVACADES